jgi:hypothetical protein
MGSDTEKDLPARARTQARELENERGEGDDALSAEEEKFVTAFVEYWTRRGAQIVRMEP